MEMHDDELITRAMEAGFDLSDILDECLVCGYLIYAGTCDCSYSSKNPSKFRENPWDEDHDLRRR